MNSLFPINSHSEIVWVSTSAYESERQAHYLTHVRTVLYKESYMSPQNWISCLKFCHVFWETTHVLGLPLPLYPIHSIVSSLCCSPCLSAPALSAVDTSYSAVQYWGGFSRLIYAQERGFVEYITSTYFRWLNFPYFLTWP